MLVTDYEIVKTWLEEYPNTICSRGTWRRHNSDTDTYRPIDEDEVKREIKDLIKRLVYQGVRLVRLPGGSDRKVEAVYKLARILAVSDDVVKEARVS